ncbi:MAG: tetratricopeptide repeat protein [Fluviicola sp.]|nr:tetratricopeptide repeat protein [Fluviicola sp.]
MEILKTLLFVCFFVGTNSSFAQTQEELQAAFTKSYKLEQEKKFGDAIKELLAIYKESSYEINLRIGWLYYAMASYDKSISYYKKAIQLMPVATEPLWGVVGPYSAKEDWINVEKTYKSILKLDPKNSIANYHMGSIYYYRKNYTIAKKYYDVSLNLNPFDYNILLMSGWTNYFLGNMSEAKVLFNKVLLNHPGDASATEGLSLIK